MALTIVVCIACFLVGGLGAYWLFRHGLRSKYEAILRDAETEAEMIKKNKLIEVKEKFLNKKAELEKEVAQRNQKIQQAENKLKQRELVLSQRHEEVQRKKAEAEAVRENLENQLAIVGKKKEELEKMQQQEILKLEAISGLSADEAKERMIESLKEEAKTQAQSYINDIMDDAKLTATKEAKRIVIQSIQRVATETAIENSVTVFHIDSDEIKGRIIGREGRNIRALEAATGVEIVVDDTPEAIVLSAFDPVRREIARLALHQLVTDGRIHPARIEEVVAKVRKQVEDEIVETGKRTTIDLGIHGLHPELIRIIGKMKYRSSYGQNLLQHARETANLCAVMASELGLNPKKARRAGLLHDIGKVPDEEPELPHALYGMKLAEKYKEKPDICNAIGAHHDEVEMTSLLAPIVQVCDAISGARPRRTPRDCGSLHQAAQRPGTAGHVLPRRHQDLRHTGRTRTARHRRCRQDYRQADREPLDRNRQKDTGRNDLPGAGEDYRHPRDTCRELRQVAPAGPPATGRRRPRHPSTPAHTADNRNRTNPTDGQPLHVHVPKRLSAVLLVRHGLRARAPMHEAQRHCCSRS